MMVDEAVTESKSGSRRRYHQILDIALWGLVAYLGAILVYGTWAWIERALELRQGGNAASALALALVGTLALILPPSIALGVHLARSRRLSFRGSLLYGLTLSMFLLVVMAATFNV